MTANGSSALRSHYALAILYLICLVSYVDRQVIALLAPDIQRDLELADWQLGFVSGTSFAVLYVFMGIPLSYIADRHSRVRLLGGCLLAWSAMTAACGAAASFVQLSLARIGVAVGEAGGYPASISMLGDLYPAERRATVTAIFFSAVPAGTLFSLYIGGMIAESIGWRLTFVAVSLPGLVLALILFLTVREPLRGAHEPDGVAPAPSAGSIGMAFTLLLGTLRQLFRDPIYRWLALALALGSVELFAIVIWSPSYAVRAFGVGTKEVGQGLGLTTGIISAVVMVAAGAGADRLRRRSVAAPINIAALGHALCVVLLMLALFSTSFLQFCVLASLGYGASAAVGPMTIAVTQSRVQPAVRATAAALLVMLSTLAGYGLGPPAVGVLSDLIGGDPAESLRAALIAGLATTALAALLLVHAARMMPRAADHEPITAKRSIA